MSNHKMKGLLKGLRYISQIFDNEKEQEMQIGYPTDVKHVGHIGWDGGASVNSPSWMNEFKSPAGIQSAPLHQNGEVQKDDNSIKWVSEDSSRRGSRLASRSPARDLPEGPKSGKQPRRHSSSAGAASESSENNNRPRQTRRSSRNNNNNNNNNNDDDDDDLVGDGATTAKPTRPQNRDLVISQGGTEPPTSSSSSDLPDVHRKTRRKKPKDSTLTGSSSSSSRSSSSKSRVRAMEADGRSESTPGSLAKVNHHYDHNNNNNNNDTKALNSLIEVEEGEKEQKERRLNAVS